MTVTDRIKSLCERLAATYPNQTNGSAGTDILIGVDDRNSRDSYPGFCHIHLKMTDPEDDQFTLILNNVPFDEEVKALAAELDGIWQTTRTGERLTLNLSAKDSQSVKGLGQAIRKVVGRGKRYLDCNWKWIASRTGNSLERLAEVLAEHDEGEG